MSVVKVEKDSVLELEKVVIDGTAIFVNKDKVNVCEIESSVLEGSDKLTAFGGA